MRTPAPLTMREGVEGKHCTMCRKWKPLDEFHVDHSFALGRSASCKQCKAASYAARKERAGGKVLQRQRVVERDGVDGSRWCPGCETRKPADAFNKDRAYARGLARLCRECVTAYRVSYHNTNRKRLNEAARKRRVATRGSRRAEHLNTRARRAGVEGVVTPKAQAALFAAQRGLCHYCGATLGERNQIDHKQPVTRGGTNWVDNLAYTCVTCNHSKCNKTEAEYWVFLSRRLTGQSCPVVPANDAAHLECARWNAFADRVNARTARGNAL